MKRIDLGWMLSKEEGFKQLAISIQDHSISGDITETESYKVLFEEAWREVYDKILYLCFLPWMTYMLLTIHFFLYFLHSDASDQAEGWDQFHK